MQQEGETQARLFFQSPGNTWNTTGITYSTKRNSILRNSLKMLLVEVALVFTGMSFLFFLLLLILLAEQSCRKKNLQPRHVAVVGKDDNKKRMCLMLHLGVGAVFHRCAQVVFNLQEQWSSTFT